MKKLLLTTLIATAAAAGVYAQGTIAVDNLNNTDPSSTAATGGLIFLNNGTTTTAYSGQLSVEVLGGANAGSMAPIVTLLGANGDTVSGGPGLFFDNNGGTYAVSGVPLNGTATLEVEAWSGNFSTLAAAQAGGGAWGVTSPFANATGGGGTPPATPVDLVGMPALVLSTPEPSTIALGGLGAAALMFFRRRK